jgi:hypothetical protein
VCVIVFFGLLRKFLIPWILFERFALTCEVAMFLEIMRALIGILAIEVTVVSLFGALIQIWLLTYFVCCFCRSF